MGVAAAQLRSDWTKPLMAEDGPKMEDIPSQGTGAGSEWKGSWEYFFVKQSENQQEKQRCLSPCHIFYVCIKKF